MKHDTIILWFRNDLRLSDNAALTAACQSNRPIIAVYILDDDTLGEWHAGSASRWWLHHSLQALKESLQAKGGNLVLRRGSTLPILLNLAEQTQSNAIYFSRAYEPYAAKLEKDLHRALEERHITAMRYSGYLLFEPERLRTKTDGFYKVFTPFWRACLQAESPRLPLAEPKSIKFYKYNLVSDKLSNWKLLPQHPNWANSFTKYWTVGEQGASKALQTFIRAALRGYQQGRDIPSQSHTSKLSPHLHFGEISPRQVWHALHAVSQNKAAILKDSEIFISQLGWREFSTHLLHHVPTLPKKPFRTQFEQFPWQKNDELLNAWQQGQTGFPLIDAGMRELWRTGWMHNRVRMVVASFLTKNLLIHWHEGEDWFWDTLVDADLANNAASWQWVAGSGVDAAPYFRIFNPVTQSKKFDPQGDYIRQWVPELSNLSNKYIHTPWQASDEILLASGITRGKTYPKPIIDLSATRERALAAFASLRK